EQAGGQWQVELEGSDPAADASQPRQRYATAEMHLAAPAVFADRLDLAQVRRDAASTLELAQMYAQCSRQGLQHDGAIRAVGQVHETAQATYIEIEVGADALADAGAYRFHPALIDGCSVGAQRLFAAFFEGEARLILPLFYASFRASAPLTTRCTARIATDTLRRKNELLYMDIEFFDHAGDKVAHLHNYACKLVRDEGAINPQRKSVMAASHGGDKARMPVAVNNAATPSTAGAVEQYLAGLMARRIGIPAGQIDTTLGYYELGLDSARLLDLVRELEVRVGAALAPTLLFEYTTIAELAQYLAQQYPGAWKEEAGAAAQVTPSATLTPAASLASAAHLTAPAASPTASPVATAPQDIAIIGMAGRYPGADDVEQFWQQLLAGADCVTEVPPARWEATRLAGISSPSGKPMSRWGGFINDADRFDAQFFRISPWEARLLDPQQRQFLEVCWAAMEDAGYTPQNLVTPRGRHQRRHVGVYAGVMHNDYALLTADAIARSEAMPVSLNYAQIANRVSYFCNFHGPSMAIDTVCSSSLIAVHMAMESLRSGECEVALAGGVNLSLHPLKYMTYGMMDMHASDGRCRAFGKGGDGYVSAEGVGAVLLKPLSHAVRDNDHIYAVIKGSTTNHVGAVSGLTVPSPVAQADMIEQCLEKTGIDPRTISYVEAHGTGTSLGDPIEIQGLTKAFGYYTSDRQYCAIGSVKSNIGHAESAAGISGLTKLALQLQHRTLVPSLHSAELNPFLDFANTPFYVQQACEPWRQPTMMQQGVAVVLPRRAALSSFGASGSNAHLILEEYVAPERTLPAPVPLLVPLSAKSAERLQAVARRLLAYLERHGASVVLADLAYTLQTGRVAMTERAVLIASDVPALRTQLAALAGHGQAALRGTVAKARPAAASEAAARLIADADLAALAQAWLHGETIDWAALHARLLPHHAAQRISLPHYPFARDRHWVDAPSPQTAATADEPAPAPAPDPAAVPAAAANVVYFTPRWQEQPLSSAVAPGGTVTIFAIGAPASLVAPAGAELKMLAASGDHAADIERHAGALLAWCQDGRRLRGAEAELLIVHAPYHATGHPYRSLMGALRTIALELPHIRTRLVLDCAIDEGNLPVMRARLRDETGAADGYTEVAYPRGQLRQVLVQQPLDSAVPAGEPTLAAVIRQQGVYLVTGGLGGLGRLFASHIGQGAGARIVLTGRSPLDAVRNEDLQRLRKQGVQAEYMVCDMALPQQVQALVEQVVARHGALHGVIHGAGVLADNFIPRTTADDLRTVLAAKLAIVQLDHATSTMALDFFVAFSSSAALGNAGQFGYATANAFLDSFMGERAALAARGQRHGRSLSINWPLWQEGGMSMQPAYAQFMREQFGIEPLQQAPGIAAFAAALASDESQFGVFQGDTRRIRALLTARPVTAESSPDAATVIATPMTASLDEDMVRAAVAQVLGMAPAALDDDVEFADYGMDSIGATRIAALLNGRLGLALSGAVFMELNSTARLIAHLRQVTLAPAALPAPPPPPEPPPEPLPIAEAPPATVTPAAESGPQAAIIGIDARLPGATDVAAYWNNLQAKTISIDDEPGGQWQARGVNDAMQDGDGGDDYRSMRHAGLIGGVELFDAAFWGLDEQAARAMDPQQRLLLRSIWHCVEDAGIAMQDLTRGRVGLFLALDALDYQ
ncbi:MAG: SDR family NAD(P)-dependent oxidoreductase, partial [Duganella sp.]